MFIYLLDARGFLVFQSSQLELFFDCTLFLRCHLQKAHGMCLFELKPYSTQLFNIL